MLKEMTEYSNEAIHEASHFIMYLVFCKHDMTLPEVKELSLKPLHRKHKAYIIYRDVNSPELTQSILETTNLPEGSGEYVKAVAVWKIKILLAGLAGEYMNMGFDLYGKEGTEVRALKLFYDKHKETDVSIAIAYNKAIGSSEEGPLQLLAIFKETIQDIKSYWEEVTTIAGLLEEQRIINGAMIEELTEDFTNRIKTK